MAGQRYSGGLEAKKPVFKTENFYQVCKSLCESKERPALVSRKSAVRLLGNTVIADQSPSFRPSAALETRSKCRFFPH
jgi:hypothetical protein